jgi:hypothetical protein
MQDYFEDFIKANSRSATLTGIMNGFIKYDWNINNDIKISMAKMLIDVYSNEENDLYKKWIKEWEEIIQTLKSNG